MKKPLKIYLQRASSFIIPALLVMFYSGCDAQSHPGLAPAASMNAINPKPAISAIADADAATILNRQQVPILCYHQIREWTNSDSKRAKDYIVPPSNFHEQIKLLADNGYHTILPDQLYDYLLKGKPLPAKPIMISFDDSRVEQFTIAREEMNKYGFKGVFFIMTVSLGRPGYMTKQEVKQLSDEGNIIGSHTWNHSNVKNYSAEDWKIQVDKPSQELEKITGRPIEYFAYPFGLWNREAIEQLKQRGFKAAFQLSAKRDEDFPQFCIRRVIVPGEWSTATLQKWMKYSF
jgi:peptidoglycan/xylan/chitin deacetylase (PgdA/CDA1 family)